MPIISSTNLLAGLSTFHLTTAYLLITSPATLLKQGLVFTLGTSMNLPQLSSAVHQPTDRAHPASFANPFLHPGNPALSLAALFLAFLALSDLTALAMREDVYEAFWSAQAPVRLLGIFALEGWIYVSRPLPGEVAEGWGRGLVNDLVFTWGFLEMLVTFWAFMALRDERKDARARRLAKEVREKEAEGL